MSKWTDEVVEESRDELHKVWGNAMGLQAGAVSLKDFKKYKKNYESFLRKKIQETVEKCAKVTKEFADSWDSSHEGGDYVELIKLVTEIREIGE